MAGLGAETRWPLLITPSNLVFYTDDRSSHSQRITFYNFFAFNIKYRGKYAIHKS